MTRTDQRKLGLWGRRVQKHRDSGLSVSKYCQREKIAIHDFYYWRRKLAGPGQQASGFDGGKQVLPTAAPAVRSHQASEADVAAMVQIQLGSQACVSVPAHMLETIRTVLQTALSCDSVNQPASPVGAFHSVILRP